MFIILYCTSSNFTNLKSNHKTSKSYLFHKLHHKFADSYADNWKIALLIKSCPDKKKNPKSPQWKLQKMVPRFRVISRGNYPLPIPLTSKKHHRRIVLRNKKTIWIKYGRTNRFFSVYVIRILRFLFNFRPSTLIAGTVWKVTSGDRSRISFLSLQPRLGIRA